MLLLLGRNLTSERRGSVERLLLVKWVVSQWAFPTGTKVATRLLLLLLLLLEVVAH